MGVATVCLGLCALLGGGSVQSFVGRAESKGALVYTESHQLTYDSQGKLKAATTLYHDPAGTLISELKSDFSQDLAAPDHHIIHHRGSRLEGLRTEQQQRVLYRQYKDKKEERKVIDKVQRGRMLMAGQGLNYYLLENLEALKDKQVIPVQYLAPGLLDSYRFRIRYGGEQEQIVNITIEVESWFLRLFAPKLYITYDKNRRRILSYKGISNIQDQRGKTQTVNIAYQYDTP